MASYPTTPAVFPARSDGQTIFAQHINALQDEVAAMENYFLATGVVAFPPPLTVPTTGAVLPTLVLDPASAATSARLVASQVEGDLNFTTNLGVVGGAWNADDVAAQGAILLYQVSTGRVLFYNAPVGANPRTPVIVLIIEPNGAIRERSRATPLGEWIDIPYSAAHFGGSGGMTWTVDAGDLTYARYMLVGKTCFFQMDVATSTLSGTGATLLTYNGLAGKVLAANQVVMPTWTYQLSPNVMNVGAAVTQPANALLQFTQTANVGLAWALGVANGTRLTVNLAFPIQ